MWNFNVQWKSSVAYIKTQIDSWVLESTAEKEEQTANIVPYLRVSLVFISETERLLKLLAKTFECRNESHYVFALLPPHETKEYRFVTDLLFRFSAILVILVEVSTQCFNILLLNISVHSILNTILIKILWILWHSGNLFCQFDDILQESAFSREVRRKYAEFRKKNGDTVLNNSKKNLEWYRHTIVDLEKH
jgi:hypothetical protein